MMKLTAVVTDKETKNRTVMEFTDYTRKKTLANDLRKNGYAVHGIYTNQDLEARNSGWETFNEMKKFSLNEEEILNGSRKYPSHNGMLSFCGHCDTEYIT